MSTAFKKVGERTYTFEYQAFEFYEACVFSLERTKLCFRKNLRHSSRVFRLRSECLDECSTFNVQLAERTVLALLNRTSATKSERKINPVQMIGIRKVRHAIVKNTIPKIIVCIRTIPFNSPASGIRFHKK